MIVGADPTGEKGGVLIEATTCAWAAGFLEGEGCFYAYLPGKCGITASQTSRRPLDKLADVFSGSVGWRSQRTSSFSGRDIWFWRVTNPVEIVKIIDGIQPFLLTKGRQAVLVREFATTTDPKFRQGGIPAEIVNRRVQIAAELRRLKRGEICVSAEEWRERRIA